MSDSHINAANLEHLFVGRERELERLTQILDKVVSGKGRLVMLVGEPGIGKTRTATEFTKIAQEQVKQWIEIH